MFECIAKCEVVMHSLEDWNFQDSYLFLSHPVVQLNLWI
jgi:hypothetical protein